MELLGHVKNFWYPKFFACRKYEECIEWVGNSIIVSACAGEASHKELKRAWMYTNRQGEAAIDQVREHAYSCFVLS